MIKRIPMAAPLCLALATGPATAFELHSSDIKPNSTIGDRFAFNGFGCTGGNVSPSLAWAHAPEGTRSFALMVHDPDAPTGGAGWWHWVVYDIPANATSIAEGAGTADGTRLPKGAIQVKTDFGTPGWGGPCPPVGDAPHRYVFTLYALKVDRLEVPEGATASLVGFMVNANTIGKSSFTALFGRRN